MCMRALCLGTSEGKKEGKKEHRKGEVLTKTASSLSKEDFGYVLLCLCLSLSHPLTSLPGTTE